MTRDVRCAVPGLLWQRKKEWKREKKREKADREKISSFVFFSSESCSLSRPSLSLYSLSLWLSTQRTDTVERSRRRRRRGQQNTVVEVSLSSGEIHASNAKNRFRMAPRRLDRRSERVFHFQRTVERISRRARKEEYEEQNHQQQEQREEQQQQRVVVVVVVVIVVVVIVVDW